MIPTRLTRLTLEDAARDVMDEERALLLAMRAEGDPQASAQLDRAQAFHDALSSLLARFEVPSAVVGIYPS